MFSGTGRPPHKTHSLQWVLPSGNHLHFCVYRLPPQRKKRQTYSHGQLWPGQAFYPLRPYYTGSGWKRRRPAGNIGYVRGDVKMWTLAWNLLQLTKKKNVLGNSRVLSLHIEPTIYIIS